MAKSRMRVAVAGTNTLALMIAHALVSETSHTLIILSRQVSDVYRVSGVLMLDVAPVSLHMFIR